LSFGDPVFNKLGHLVHSDRGPKVLPCTGLDTGVGVNDGPPGSQTYQI
jgi:hypothetical protein